MGGGTTRRDFLRHSAAGLAATAAGGLLYSVSRAEAAHVDVHLFVTGGSLPLHDGHSVYHLGYSPTADGLALPGSVIRAIEGDSLTVSITNTLAEPHSFTIAGVADSGPIAPGQTATVSFAAPRAGTYLYADRVDAPVNRVLGLQGAMVVHVAGAAEARELVWVFSCLDPRWGEQARLGRAIDPSTYEPRIFLINGRFGAFSSRAADTAPHGHVGEAALIRMVNAGLTAKAIHFHGNHVRVVARDGRPPPVPMTKDTVLVGREERVDVVLPFRVPPDAYPPTRRSVYPIHDHHEMTQTLHGGLYPNGLLTDWHLAG